MTTVAKINGLDTADNPLSSVKDGSLKTADNVVIRSKNILEPRRGLPLYGGTFGAGSDRANTFAFFDSGVVLQYGTSLAQTTGTSNYTGISGTFTPPDATTLRMKFVEEGQRLYLTSTAGVYALDQLAATARLSGVLPANEVRATLTGEPDGTSPLAWLPKNNQVAYRIVYGFKDGTDSTITHWGAPSGRGVVVNPPDIVTSVVLSRTTNVVTATFATPHKFVIGDKVRFTEVADGTFNPGPTGTTGHVITSVGSNGLTLTYAETAANGSSALVHTFTSGAKSATVAFIPLPGSSSAYYIRVYRSAPSGSATTPPDDELYLVNEFTGVDPATYPSGYSLTDTTPELALYSSPLYTNELTDEGALQANYPPPLCEDLAAWGGRMWFANTTGKHTLDVQCLGVSAPSGLQVGDTITVGGVVYTAAAADAYPDFLVHAEGTATQNTAATIIQLVFNVEGKQLAGTSTCRAYYMSGSNDAPGKIRFERSDFSSTAFTFATSRTTAFHPAISPQSSKQDVFPNRVFYSKAGEPEAVPLLNYVDVGPKNKAILRIVPLREKLFVFKEDAIYTISGDAPNLRVDLLDNTAWLMAPDSAVAANNQIYALTNQGVVSVTEGGVGIISRPIADKIESGFFAPIAAGTATVKAMVWGAAYESERLYLLGLTTNASSTTADQILAYNYLNNTWTRWDVAAKFAAVDPTTDRLYLAPTDTNKLVRERKAFTYADYADREVAVTVSSATGTSIVLSSASGVAAGDVIVDDSSSSTRLITAVDSNTLTVTGGTGAIATFAGAATVYKAISVSLEFNPVVGNPEDSKHFAYSTLHFNRFNAYDADLSTRTEQSTTVTLTPITAPTFTLAAEPTECINIRKPVPLEKQRSSLMRVGLRITEAWSRFQLNGFSVEDTNASNRNSR